jgi:hypothetical protein
MLIYAGGTMLLAVSPNNLQAGNCKATPVVAASIP